MCREKLHVFREELVQVYVYTNKRILKLNLTKTLSFEI
jgi:hypothetical protein